MKNCADCDNYKNSFGTCPDGYMFVSRNEDSCLGIKYAKCESGNNEQMKEWWDKNGHLPKEDTEEMPCYQPTKFDILLNNILNLSNGSSN